MENYPEPEFIRPPLIPPRDCSEKVYRMQFDMLMALSNEERFKIGLQMMEDGSRLMQSGVRARFPNATEEEFQIEMLRHLKRMNPEKLHWVKV